MKNKILQYVLSGLIIPSALLSWWVLDRAINVPDSSVWSLPIVCFSLFSLLIFLGAVVVKDAKILRFVIFLSFAASFIFALDGSRIVFGLLSLLFVFVGVRKIRKDLMLNIKIDLGKSLAAGKTFVVIALAIMVSSQYFSTVRNQPQVKMIPRVGMGGASGLLTSEIISVINPEYKKMTDSNMTVDEFILETRENQLDISEVAGPIPASNEQLVDQMISKSGGDKLPPDQKEVLRQSALKEINSSKQNISDMQNPLVLAEGRKQFSDMAGTPLTGQEKVSDVFSDIINNKITSYFAPVTSDENAPPLVPIIIALILFLTIVPLGNFLGIFLAIVSRMIFFIMRKNGLVEIRKEMAEVEILA